MTGDSLREVRGWGQGHSFGGLRRLWICDIFQMMMMMMMLRHLREAGEVRHQVSSTGGEPWRMPFALSGG